MPAFVVAVMLSALPRVSASGRPFLFRAVGGVALLGLADAAFAVASWGQWYDPASWIAGANELGLLLLLDAALVTTLARPAAPAEARPEAGVVAGTAADVEVTRRLLVVAAPYAPLVAALAMAIWAFGNGRGISHDELGPALLIGAALVVRHLASARETGHLVARLARASRRP